MWKLIATRKQILLITLGIIVLLAAISAALLYTSSATNDQIISSAKQGGAWLLHYSGNLKDPGILWGIHEINNTYCHNVAVREQVTTRSMEFKADPDQIAYIKLIDPTLTLDVSYFTRPGDNDEFLLPALYCTDRQITEAEKAHIADFKGQTGYDLTHHFLALLFMKKNGCEPEWVSEKINEMIPYLDFKDTDVFGDLYAEKAAFFEIAGHGEKVTSSVAMNIVKHQSDTGGWKDPEFFNKVDNPHTTLLAVWALSQYAGMCPF